METNVGENEESVGYSFKSYYVVWKPFFIKKSNQKKESLNRTM